MASIKLVGHLDDNEFVRASLEPWLRSYGSQESRQRCSIRTEKDSLESAGTHVAVHSASPVPQSGPKH